MWHRLRKVRSISRESTKPDGTIIVLKQRKKIINAFLLKLIVYLAVEICHRWTSLSATPSFQVGKNFDNRQKHQRRRSAWVGQANFGKRELNNRNHWSNCQRLSLKHDQFEIDAAEFSDFRAFVDGRDYYYPWPFQGFFENSLNSIQFNFIYTFIKYWHYI